MGYPWAGKRKRKPGPNPRYANRGFWANIRCQELILAVKALHNNTPTALISVTDPPIEALNCFIVK